MKALKAVAVFSGGGARGTAHVGAVQAMHELGFDPIHFVGTSMGAVIGAAFASGLTYADVLQRVSSVTRRDVAGLSPTVVMGPLARSLLRAGPFRRTIGELVPARTFDELVTPLTVTAVDMHTGELVLFGSGGRRDVPLVDALYASCALPLYYPPAVIDDVEYADGGLRAVFPLDSAAEIASDVLVGVNVGPSMRDNAPTSGLNAGSIVTAHRRSLRIMMAAQTDHVLHRWTEKPARDCIIVEPRLMRTGTFAIDRIVDYVEGGYRATYRDLSRYLTERRS